MATPTQQTTTVYRTPRPGGRRSLTIIIGVIVVLLLMAAAYYSVAEYNQNQKIAAQNHALKAAPVTGVTQVAMQGYVFTPANIAVKVGTTVTWTNDDNAPHSVTFDNGMKDSGLFMQGQSYNYTFTRPGVYQYHCSEHPFMVGRVTVIS